MPRIGRLDGLSASERPPGHYLEVRKRLNEQGSIRKSHAPSTVISLQGVKLKRTRYCNGNDEDPQRAMQACTKGDCMAFLMWILDGCHVQKRNSLCQYWKVFRMLHRRDTGRDISKEAVDEFIDGPLKEDYSLDLTRREKPVLHVNDLLLVLHHHWALDTETFPNERQRLQLAALLLTAAYTGARPGSLVCAHTTGKWSRISSRSPSITEPSNTLCYKDIKVLVLRNDDRQQRDVMVMEIDLTHVKGDRINSKPKKFLFHEHDNLAFCPIAHILALAFADEAFEPKIAHKVGDLFHAKASRGSFVTHVRFKSQLDNVPVFRQATSSAEGYGTSARKALRYHVFNNYLQRLGRSTGFEQILTAYCVRRGTGNALDGVASDAERNQVMGHQSSRTFQFYLNHHVTLDVQAAFLGTPSKHAHNVALGSMSRSLDRRAPTKLTPHQRTIIRSDPTVTRLRLLRDGLSKDIKMNPAFRTISAAKETEIYKQYKQAQSALNAARWQCNKSTLKDAREEYFRTVGTKDLDEQFLHLPAKLRTDEITPAEAVERAITTREKMPQLLSPVTAAHTFLERKRVAELLFEDPSCLTWTEKLERRIDAVANMAALCSLREPRRRERPGEAQAKTPGQVIQKQGISGPLIVPRRCLNTQCLFCLGDTALSHADRAFSFSCPPAAKRHTRKQHLERLCSEEDVACPHPTCKDLHKLANLRQFKIHAARVHGVKL